jgi:hypothetical protein
MVLLSSSSILYCFPFCSYRISSSEEEEESLDDADAASGTLFD